jgi:hypothetical protein
MVMKNISSVLLVPQSPDYVMCNFFSRSYVKKDVIFMPPISKNIHELECTITASTCWQRSG